MKFSTAVLTGFLLLLLFISSASAASGEYAIGDKITLSGTNPNSEYTYLYIQGVNKPLQDIPLRGGDYLTTATHGIDVDDASNRWSVSFYLANKFDAGTYTIIASPVPFEYTSGHNVKKEDDQILGTVHITLRGAYFADPVQTVTQQTPVPTQPTVQPTVDIVRPTAPETPAPAPMPESPAPFAGILLGLAAVFVVMRNN